MAQSTPYSIPDPYWLQVQAMLPPMDTSTGDFEKDMAAGREYYKKWAQLGQALFEPQVPADAKLKVDDHTVAAEGGEIRVRVVAPEPQGDEKYPLLVYYHPGGFYLGDIDTKDYSLRALSHKHRIVTVNVEYRLAAYPKPFDDAYTALKWAVENSARLSADPTKGLIVMGSSAGAMLSASLALRARDDPFFASHQLTGQILQFPGTIHPDAHPEQYKDRLLSLEENKDGPILTTENVRGVWRWLNAEPTNTDVSVLLAPDKTRLPRAVLQLAGMDPLRDEGILYGELLRDAGVDVTTHVYPGVPHCFEELLLKVQAPIAAKQQEDLDTAIRSMINAS